jgi:excisionase family DNA binding protein
MNTQPAASPSARGVEAALVAVNAIRVLEARVQLLEAENAALLAERNGDGPVVQAVPRLALNIAETAAAIGASKDVVTALVHRGELASTRVGPRWFVSIAGIERWLAQSEQAPTPLRVKGAR